MDVKKFRINAYDKDTVVKSLKEHGYINGKKLKIKVVVKEDIIVETRITTMKRVSDVNIGYKRDDRFTTLADTVTVEATTPRSRSIYCCMNNVIKPKLTILGSNKGVVITFTNNYKNSEGLTYEDHNISLRHSVDYVKHLPAGVHIAEKQLEAFLSGLKQYRNFGFSVETKVFIPEDILFDNDAVVVGRYYLTKDMDVCPHSLIYERYIMTEFFSDVEEYTKTRFEFNSRYLGDLTAFRVTSTGDLKELECKGVTDDYRSFTGDVGPDEKHVNFITEVFDSGLKVIDVEIERIVISKDSPEFDCIQGKNHNVIIPDTFFKKRDEGQYGVTHTSLANSDKGEKELGDVLSLIVKAVGKKV